MQGEKKYLNGLINADDDFSFVAPNEMVNGQNIRFGSTDDGATGKFEKIKGNQEVFDGFEYVASETFTNRGSVEDEARNRIIFFAYHNDAAANHAIYAYDKQAATTYTVLKEDQITGGLGIISTKYIDAVRVWGDLLIWTTATGEVKVINMEAGIKLNHVGYSTTVTPYVSPLKQEDISLIKRPCLFAPAVNKTYNSGFSTSLTGDEAWQFSYVYQYADFQEAVAGEWSLTMNYNRKGENYNGIEVFLPLTEDVPQTVRKIKLLAKELSTGTVKVVHIWDKDLSADATAISTHNAGTVDANRLYFAFYNNVVIETYSNVLAAKIEDLVPLDVNTLEINSDRLFLSNYKTGFNGTGKSSLTLTPVTSYGISGPSSPVDMYKFEAVVTKTSYVAIPPATETQYIRAYVVNLPFANPAGWYVITGAYDIQAGSYPTVTAPTSPVTIGIYLGIDESNIGNMMFMNVATNSYTNVDTTTDVVVTAYYASSTRMFKSNSSRTIGVTFYDRAGRIIETTVLPANLFSTQQSFGGVLELKTESLTCTLSNAAALTEIPDDAYYYSFVIGENTVTKNFIEFKEKAVTYGRKNADGTYTLDLASPDAANYLVIDGSSLPKNGIGYVFNEGDFCRFGVQIATLSGSNYIRGTIKVVGQSGKYILCELYKFGVITSNISFAFWEIYTPYKQSGNEFLYETGNRYVINNPGSGSRAYSQLTHSIAGDTSFVYRVDSLGVNYMAEAMSPNDNYWKRWFTNSGRPIVPLKGKKINQTNYVAWSGQYFIGTQINGSSTFEINNNQALDVEAGAVRKLQTANRIQGEGGVMLAICERETLSLYVGRAQISDETQFNLLLKTDTVIGTVNGLRGSYGTKHPESVVEFRGNIYWFDVSNGAFVSYSGNGLFDISSYKFKRPTQLLAARMRLPDITGDVPLYVNFIPGGIDIKHEEVLWSIPQTESDHPKGYLDEYIEVEFSYYYRYPYDIYDGLSKTWVYKINADKWACPHIYTAEGFARLNNDLYSFKTGRPHVHNAVTSYNSFYNVSTPSFVAFACNQTPSAVKNFKSVAIESNAEPSWLHMRTEFPNVQSTELVQGEFTDKEGIWYASLFRDRLSPNASGSLDQIMINGDPMTGQYLLCRLEFSEAGDQLNFRFANVYYDQSEGHKI